jgi:hypothetical protein
MSTRSALGLIVSLVRDGGGGCLDSQYKVCSELNIRDATTSIVRVNYKWPLKTDFQSTGLAYDSKERASIPP